MCRAVSWEFALKLLDSTCLACEALPQLIHNAALTLCASSSYFPLPWQVTLSPFLIGKHEVSNARFQAFVGATGYVTEAERFGNSFVVEQFISKKVAEKISSAVVRHLF